MAEVTGNIGSGLWAGMSLKQGSVLNFHYTRVTDPQIGVWCPHPKDHEGWGSCAYWYGEIKGATNATSKQESAKYLLKNHVADISKALNRKEIEITAFLEGMIAKIDKANEPAAPKPPKAAAAPKEPKVTVPPPSAKPSPALAEKLKEAARAQSAKAAKKN